MFYCVSKIVIIIIIIVIVVAFDDVVNIVDLILRVPYKVLSFSTLISKVIHKHNVSFP